MDDDDDDVKFERETYEKAKAAGKVYVMDRAGKLDERIKEGAAILKAMDDQLADNPPPRPPFPDLLENLRHGRALQRDKVRKLQELREEIRRDTGI